LIGHGDLSLSVSSRKKTHLSENALAGIRSYRPVVAENGSLRQEADILSLSLTTYRHLSPHIHDGEYVIIDRNGHREEWINVRPQPEGTIVLKGRWIEGTVPHTGEIWGAPSTTT
jgi:hypothetical protein